MRIEGARCTGAGDYWLSATPSAALNLKLSNKQQGIVVSLRLGAPISLPHKCSCNPDVSESATHHLSCRFSAGRHSRHANLNNIVKSAFAAIKIPTVLEPSGLFRDDGKRPDGMTVTPFQKGKYVVWDATCIDRSAASYRAIASGEGPAAARLAEERKERKYSKIGASYEFLPLAFETLGGMGPAVLQLVQRLSLSIPSDERLTY